MKTIATLQGPDFLRQCNRIRHAAAALMRQSGVMALRKRMPVLTGEETAEQHKAAIEAQSRKNVSAMLDCLLEEYPEQTCEVLAMLCLPEDSDTPPDGMDLAMAGLELVTSPKVLDFFSRLASLALPDGNG